MDNKLKKLLFIFKFIKTFLKTIIMIFRKMDTFDAHFKKTTGMDQKIDA